MTIEHTNIKSSNVRKRYIVDYGSTTGPIRSYSPAPAGTMPLGGRRGKIAQYSPRSRRNFTRKIHKLSARWEQIAPLSVTLTLPGKSWEQIAPGVVFKRWTARLSYTTPEVWGVWVIEYQKRGAAHYHLALDSEAIAHAHGSWRRFRDWVRDSWYACVDSGQDDHLIAGTHVEPYKKLPTYIAKDMGKRLNYESWSSQAPNHTGRFWGKIGSKILASYQVENMVEVSEGEYYMFHKALLARWNPQNEDEMLRLPQFLPNRGFFESYRRTHWIESLQKRPITGKRR